jgi:hypothetical protein
VKQYLFQPAERLKMLKIAWSDSLLEYQNSNVNQRWMRRRKRVVERS